MFFLASKLLAFLVQPITWLLVALLVAFLVPREPVRRRMVGAILGFLLVLTNPLILTGAFWVWEPTGVAIDEIVGTYDVAIVLGGISNATTAPQDRLYFNRHASRMTQALELHGQGKVRKVLFVGGLAPILGETESEAARIQRFLRRIGFPAEDLLLEDRSRNTAENAVFSGQVLEKWWQGTGRSGSPRYLLLTDGYHMRRSLACFAAAGVPVVPFVTSRVARAPRMRHLESYLFPWAQGLMHWGNLARELAGLAAYKAAGKI